MTNYEVTDEGEGPFKSAFDIDKKGVIRREIITYRIKNGMMRKEVATRSYFRGYDYNDSITITPLPGNNDESN